MEFELRYLCQSSKMKSVAKKLPSTIQKNFKGRGWRIFAVKKLSNKKLFHENW